MTLTAEQSSHKAEYEALPTDKLIERIRFAMSEGCIRPCHVYDLVDEALDRLAKAASPKEDAETHEGTGTPAGSKPAEPVIYRCVIFAAQPSSNPHFLHFPEIRVEDFLTLDDAFDFAKNYVGHHYEVRDSQGFRWHAGLVDGKVRYYSSKTLL